MALKYLQIVIYLRGNGDSISVQWQCLYYVGAILFDIIHRCEIKSNQWIWTFSLATDLSGIKPFETIEPLADCDNWHSHDIWNMVRDVLSGHCFFCHLHAFSHRMRMRACLKLKFNFNTISLCIFNSKTWTQRKTD